MVTYSSFVEFILFSLTSFFFGYSFNEAYHTPGCQVHSLDKFLLFPAFSARHGFGIWVSFISPNYVLGFSTSKSNSLCVLSFDDHMATNLVSVVWKFSTCWFFFLAGSSSVPNMVEGSASPLTHTRLIESEVLTCLSHLVMVERVGERDSLSHC